MKSNRLHILLPALALMMAASLPAQQSNPGSTEDPYADSGKTNPNLPASFGADILRDKDGKVQPMRGMFIFKVDAGRLVVADNPQGARFENIEPATIKFLALELPEDILTAIDTYESRKFAEALPLLDKAVKRYQALRAVDGSPVARMEIMWMDCLRRTKKFPELRDALAVFKPESQDSIGKDYMTVFPAWEAHANRDWKRIEAISRDIDAMFAGTPAAELAYLRGEALRRLDRKPEALAEYHRAMAMDFTRSRDIFGDAALGALEIYVDDPLVKDYFDRVGGEDFNPEGAYIIPTKEAALLAHLVQTLQPGGRTLPSNAKRFLDAFASFQKASAEAEKAGTKTE